MHKELEVLISGKATGILSQDSSGNIAFQYHNKYHGIPLSSAMPLSTQVYRNKTVMPYLWGLLPEDPDVRRLIASDFHVSPNNPFSLLSIIGLDCPGAVQFCIKDSNSQKNEYLIQLSEAAIAHRLSLSRNSNTNWIIDNEHWSLGGQQSKFALQKQGENWFSCKGAAPTTHILKSGVKGLAHQALNEYICMRLASECDINTAKVDYYDFQGENSTEPAIIIERYDRIIQKKKIIRLHQEDFCQALGFLPDNKYSMYGGPSITDIFKLLMGTGPVAQANVVSFIQMILFNYLLAATDAHAKNFSIMLDSEGAHRLAPMYDVASIAPYIEPVQWIKKPPKLAMSIGGENRIGYLSPNHLNQMIIQSQLEKVGITADGCVRLLLHYAKIIPQKISDIFDSLEETESKIASNELRIHMEKPIKELCEKTRARFECEHI